MTPKKLAIVGSRSFTEHLIGYIEVDKLRETENITTIISGGAKGADRFGKFYARSRHIKYIEYPADWDEYGKSAGFIRNETMADNCDIAIVFWDGMSRGTKNMINLLQLRNKPIIIVMFDPPREDDSITENENIYEEWL